MDWLWGSKKSTQDSTSNLDPSLRDFLDKETKQQQDKQRQEEARRAQAAEHQGDGYREAVGLDTTGNNISTQFEPKTEPVRPQVPAQSQFQDGRYADLWKTYRTQEELATITASDQDKMSAVMDNYTERKAEISRAAMENCVLEQITQHECFGSGSWSQLTAMCRDETRAFNRCYEMQSRFLRALGYLNHDRSTEEAERVQMHADTIYHEMLDREKQIKEAKERGEELALKPLIQPEEAEKVLGKDSAWSRMRQLAAEKNQMPSLAGLPAKRQKEIVDKLQDLTVEEKAIELQLLAAEVRVAEDLKNTYIGMRREQMEARQKRREEGTSTFGDRLISVWKGEQTKKETDTSSKND